MRVLGKYMSVIYFVWIGCSQLDSSKSLVDQCVQGEGMVQINLEVKSQPGVKPKINILDILKTAEDEVEEKYSKFMCFFFSLLCYII